eukprot:TRINITY_DN9904_c0_g1_i1.p1 TRINITY_DN9904_c0_g1~~TRINITY_DN9904_c0_g1_i1.p1  ORF type:complete len:525 (+),score=122.47 TRINITY_DN9904_c0_g1_i1:8-1582(+)
MEVNKENTGFQPSSNVETAKQQALRAQLEQWRSQKKAAPLLPKQVSKLDAVEAKPQPTRKRPSMSSATNVAKVSKVAKPVVRPAKIPRKQTLAEQLSAIQILVAADRLDDARKSFYELAIDAHASSSCSYWIARANFEERCQNFETVISVYEEATSRGVQPTSEIKAALQAFMLRLQSLNPKQPSPSSPADQQVQFTTVSPLAPSPVMPKLLSFEHCMDGTQATTTPPQASEVDIMAYLEADMTPAKSVVAFTPIAARSGINAAPAPVFSGFMETPAKMSTVFASGMGTPNRFATPRSIFSTPGRAQCEETTFQAIAARHALPLNGFATTTATTGSELLGSSYRKFEVVKTPKSIRSKLGSEVAVTPVRRSARKLKTSESEPVASLLEQAGNNFVPNPFLMSLDDAALDISSLAGDSAETIQESLMEQLLRSSKQFRARFKDLWKQFAPNYATTIGHICSDYSHILKPHMLSFADANNIAIAKGATKDETAVTIVASLFSKGVVGQDDGVFVVKQPAKIQQCLF